MARDAVHQLLATDIAPTTWLIVTGWSSTEAERKILGGERMTADPWTDADPQPGDFDAELAKLDPRYVDRHEGDPEAKLSRARRHRR